MSLLNSVLKVFVGDKSKQDEKAITPIVNQIKTFESALEALSHDELRAKTAFFKSKIAEARQPFNDKIEKLQKEADETEDIDQREDIYQEIDRIKDDIYKATEDTLNDILPEAFAVVKETAKRFVNNTSIPVTASTFDREISGAKSYVTLDGDKAVWANSWDAAGKAITWDMIHYDVQLIGGVALHQGKIAEMQTGEGKTLVASLPMYLNALAGKGVHLVTVNDYLAKRDSAWMAPIFEFHGLSVDCIDYHQPNSDARKKAYNADITYGTNNEFGFDYLRDNMAHSPDDLVQRPHHYAIVDEVDSVLVDDARTPLIISGPVPQGDRHEFTELKPKVDSIVEVQRKYLTGVLAEAKKLIAEGDTKEGGFKLLRAYRGIPKNKALIKFLSEEGIKQLLQKTENFYMQDNNREMPKVDEELYYVIDEKNNQVELSDKGVEYLSGKEDPNFFVMPEIGTEIAKIEAQNLSKEAEADAKEDLFRDFGVKSERIHTLNQLLKAYALFEKDIQYVVIDNKVMIVDEQTGRIMDGRRYSDGLHQAIEAKENVISAINFFSFDEDIVVEDCTELTELYALIGPQSSKHIASLSEKDFITPSVNNASIGTIFDLPVVIVRTDYLNICSYEVLVISPGKSIDSRITETRIPFAGTGALEICRIENGLPIFGSELGERFNPLEDGLMDAVSFDKGCYVGQEVVARLNTYDKVKRQLIQLDWNTAGVKTGDAIFLNDQQIGELTSFVRLPNSTYIGLGYCSRKSNPVDVEIGLKRTAARVLKPIN